MVLAVKIDQIIAEKIEVKSLFPFFWDTRYMYQPLYSMTQVVL